ncbi:MAG: transcription termination/antitermination factor NusG [Nitrospirae bacterium RIFOXYB2_FULL_43_5]|nr:MAG: transcription termination/antitermination factor NusG [Nitrospirae bacterium GWF2_44_13]OGW65674.1 MAG: transcription termination/antitermination factor NusG [Nitrospirae bacterium RIFOXYA2_FULL_44_9]OGW74004.1 MAG: transcription termination/antitermination factor NusG [Nitrospirae bacterium RIFOXYB2_FULL_43_5]OGW74296.1 MAG: transcription termination/antitermination factor NusG [Nitrospirae bacterium RIFOXYC2_FULL_44_7]HBG92311.1 transcription termination/antitermination protein NusG [
MGKNWYVVHTYSGSEEKVKQAIEDKADKKNFRDKIAQVLVPTERIIELKGGGKKESNKKFYPGYILIEMELDDESWHLVRKTPRVTGFVGGSNPVALSQEEVDVILQQMEKGHAPQVKTQYQKNETVRITDGPFSNFLGYIEDVDMDNGRLKVMVSIFGRQTPVELNFFQVERA